MIGFLGKYFATKAAVGGTKKAASASWSIFNSLPVVAGVVYGIDKFAFDGALAEKVKTAWEHNELTKKITDLSTNAITGIFEKANINPNGEFASSLKENALPVTTGAVGTLAALYYGGYNGSIVNALATLAITTGLIADQTGGWNSSNQLVAGARDLVSDNFGHLRM